MVCPERMYVRTYVLAQQMCVSAYVLAQQSCGGDIGSVPYVCMFVRTYVRSYVHILSSL